MQATRCLGLMLIVATLAACARPEPEAPAVDIGAEMQAIRDRSAEWQKLAAAKDAAGIMSGIFASEAATLYDGNIRKGAAEILAGLQADFAASPDMTVSWTTTEVHVAASGDLAYERGQLTEDRDGAGAQPAQNGEFVTVWSKADGTWRVVADAGTMAKPGEAAATPAAN